MSDEYTASGHHKDYAHRIQSEQNRDAMPTQAEAKQAHRDHLAAEGCRECGHDDPDDLEHVRPLTVDCTAIQQRHEPIIMCGDCQAERETMRERQERQARAELGAHSHRVVLVVYGCGNYTTDVANYPTITETVQVGWDDETGEAIMDEQEIRLPGGAGGPTVEFATQCGCGAEIETIDWFEPDAGGDD